MDSCLLSTMGICALQRKWGKRVTEIILVVGLARGYVFAAKRGRLAELE